MSLSWQTDGTGELFLLKFISVSILFPLPFLSSQILLDVLDGTMVVLAMYTLAIINPGHFLYRDAEEDSDMLDKGDMGSGQSSPRATY